MSTSYASLFGRLRFGLARRLLYLWARSSRIGDSNEELAIDPQQPVIYVLPYRSLTDLIVADRECVKAGLPRPVRAPLPPLDERDAFIFLSRERSWVGRPDPRGQSPRLGKVLEHLTPKRGRDVATPFDDPTQDPLEDLDERTRDVASTLIQRRRLFHQARRRIEDKSACSFLFVMTPERLPILETDRAVKALEEVRIPVAGVLINRVIPADADGEFLAARRQQEATYLARIEQHFRHLPRPVLPWLPTDVQGIEVLEQLAAQLEQQGF